MLDKSAIVSAHPDDEALWFSSILEDVGDVIICFLEFKSKPHWAAGRKQSFSEYPLKKNIVSLDIDTSEARGGADWDNPVITKYGIELSKKPTAEKKYKENYHRLKKDLQDTLTNYENIFTHSPWGEYGHEEHIQVYRVVNELQHDMKFNLWFPNYCSNISFHLMQRYISGFDSNYITMKTNKVLANHIKNIYKKNDCWTWYDDWEWFNEESFMKDTGFDNTPKGYGHFFPLNYMKIEISKPPERQSKHGLTMDKIADPFIRFKKFLKTVKV